MLNLNQDKEEDSKNDQNVWKVLVFDSFGRDLISSVLRVSDLFKNGVTVHMLLNADRYPIPDVPAVYFVSPTAENVKIIAKDLANGLYESAYLNFISPLPRDLLEDLAQQTVYTSNQISQVYDQYLNFIVSEPNIYSLGMENVYSKLANPKVQEEEIQGIINQIVNGLFSVVLTSGSIPIIRCTRGNAAEMIAQKLDEKLRNHVLNSRNLQHNTASKSTQQNRPVLIIVDRNIDLVSMFTHSWTYQSLINDACELNRNRITVQSEDDEGKTTRKSYDLDPDDFFWAKNSGLPFPEVADNLDAALNKYKTDAKEIMGQTGVNNLEDVSQLDPSSNAQHLRTAINSLPELTARKQTIDMHMNIATTLLKAIGDRGLAQLFEAEENATKQTKGTILELINNPAFKNPEDKLRMFLVYFIMTDNIPTSDLAEFESALTQQGCDLSALTYIKRVKEITRMNVMSGFSSTNQTSQSTGQSTDLFKSFSGITNKLTDRLKDGKLSEGFGNLISGVKNLLPTSKDLAVTKIVESILEPNPSNPSATDDYLYFDPKATRGSLTRPPKRDSYDEAIIFTVGGGNYYEYGNLQDWVARTGGIKKVIYGSTSLCSPSKFVAECANLGSS
ncbi:hypothetical protein TRICI_004080 [Trichomonascus ciferrii]|uniref:Sec1-like protein n=1 Tax=Trichomonascus ciferrii TaxID=44093 RepID=A0A642V718_9ASCO|nr:hypothetical protein TRICI_004080 [Trichomonascus ciferrii]